MLFCLSGCFSGCLFMLGRCVLMYLFSSACLLIVDLFVYLLVGLFVSLFVLSVRLGCLFGQLKMFGCLSVCLFTVNACV